MTPRLSFDPSPAPQNRPTCTLPPLILHPFADASGPGKLVESSRASLKLQGLLPNGESSREDLARWIDQCLEFADRNRAVLPAGTSYQSFAAMLVKDAPANVQSKLRKWGVADYKAIFTRALGLHCLFATAPTREVLSDEFVRSYYRYADQIFAVKQGECDFTPVSSADCHFELYSSGEYSRMLERSWEESAG